MPNQDGSNALNNQIDQKQDDAEVNSDTDADSSNSDTDSNSGSDIDSDIEYDFEENGIGYNIEDDAVIAFHMDDHSAKYDKEVGKLEVEECFLAHIEVINKYRNRGIATRMLQLAIERLDLRCVPAVMEASEYHYSLTPAGEQFVAACVRKKIIPTDWCVFSGASELLEDGETDPGYDSQTVQSAIMAVTGRKNTHNAAKMLPLPDSDIDENNDDDIDADAAAAAFNSDVKDQKAPLIAGLVGLDGRNPAIGNVPDVKPAQPFESLAEQLKRLTLL